MYTEQAYLSCVMQEYEGKNPLGSRKKGSYFSGPVPKREGRAWPLRKKNCF